MTKFSSIGAAILLILALCVGGCGGSEAASGPARYDITIHNGWPQTADEKQVGHFLESSWRDPVGPVITVDSRSSDETGSPLTNAEVAKLQTAQLPDYRERTFKEIKLGGRPTIQWGFDISKEESRFELFFEECDTAFIVRGSMGTVGYEAFADSFREMAATLKADCDE